MQISKTMAADILDHARRMASLSPPQEMAGVITEGMFHPVPNIAPNPSQNFAIAPKVIDGFAAVDAIVHSHPGGPHYPSHQDMQQQILMGIPWVIAVVATPQSPQALEDIFVFGDGGLGKAFTTAGYRHGVHDCYSLIRAYYHQEFGLDLDDVPRGWDWWHNGGDLYAHGFAAHGFSVVPPGQALARGDVFLARVRSPVVNHAGLWLGDGLILHHLGGRDGYQPQNFPRKEPAERWQKFIQMWIRHRDLPNASAQNINPKGDGASRLSPMAGLPIAPHR